VAERRWHYEVWSDGVDEQLQGVSGDPYAGTTAMGLRIPFKANTAENRYEFMLCGVNLPENVSANVRGIRQFASMGIKFNDENGNPIVVEQPITQPQFRLPDGNISWHLRFFPQVMLDKYRLGNGTTPSKNTQNFVQTMSLYPALLYQKANLDGTNYYVKLTSYLPPNEGRPMGDAVAHLGTFHDLRFPWNDAHAWHSTDIPIEGPGFIALMASVKQSSGLYAFAPTTLDISPEQNFISQFALTMPTANNTGVILWRVGGALRIALEELPPDGRKCDQAPTIGRIDEL
jgi:hypothetical protein